MKKIFTRMMGAAVISAAALPAPAANDAGGNFIYLPPVSSYAPPTSNYYAEWEENKLYETSPGSNIYEGTFDQLAWNGYFRFFTELAPEEYGYASYRMNQLHPADDPDNPNHTMQKYGFSGVYRSRMLEYTPAAATESCWIVPQGSYRINVDLSSRSVHAVPEGTILMLINDDSTPTLQNIGRYCSAENIDDYYDAGDISIYLYDIYNDMWLNPAGDPELKTGNGSPLTFTAIRTKGEPFTLTGWQGGGLKFARVDYISGHSGTLYMDVLADSNYKEVDNDEMFVDLWSVPNSPWKGCSDEVRSMFTRLRRNDDGTYSGTARVPQGKFRMRIISGLTERGEENYVLAPATTGDRDIVPVNNTFHSSAINTTSMSYSYWTCDYNIVDMRENGGWEEGDVTITVTPGDKPSVKFDFVNPGKKLYLVGTHNNWDNTDPSYALDYTPNGGYYGSFYLDADTEFKFISNLGDWYSAFGAHFGNGYVDMSGGDHKSDDVIVNGGGDNWVLNHWDGGLVYMYIRPYDDYVHFSAEPIPDSETGIDVNDEHSMYLYYSSGDKQEKKRAMDSGDGIYTFNLGNSFAGAVNELRLFTRKLPISQDEKEWEGSYALCPAATEAVKFDNLGVAEISFTTQDYLTDKGCAPFRFDCTGYSPELYNYILTVDTNKNKVYLERWDYYHHYLLGTISGDRYPTYETRAEFAKYLVPRNGAVIDVPAGELGFGSYRSIFEASKPENRNFQHIDVELADGVAYTADILGLGWNNKHVIVRNWNGGKAIVGSEAVIDLSTVNELTTADGDRFTETAPGSLIYKGTAHFTTNHIFSFDVKKYAVEGEPTERLFSLTSRTIPNGASSVSYYDGEDILIPQSGVITGNAGFQNYSFYMPSWIGEGDIDMIIDLNTMTITGSMSNENAGSIYEAVSDDNDGLDGLMGFPSNTQENAVALRGAINTPASFNLTAPSGIVIIPASGNDTPVEFDEAGTWSGEYKRATAPSAGRKAARAAARQNGKWVIDMPEGAAGHLDMLIDEANNRITIVSSAHNTGYFITQCNSYGGNLRSRGVEFIDEMKQNMLMPTAPGIWEGDFSFDPEAANADSDMYLRFESDLYSSSGLYNVLGENDFTVFDLTDNAAAQQFAHTSNSVSSWVVKGCPEKVHIRYDSYARTLTMTNKTTGVEDMTIGADDYNRPVEYYNLQGIRVENPANGIYIRRQGSKSEKVLIR